MVVEFGGGGGTNVGMLGGVRRGKGSAWVITAEYEEQSNVNTAAVDNEVPSENED